MMAQANNDKARYRTIGVVVAGIALLGWLLMLYFWSVANDNRQELERIVILNGTAEDIDERIEAARQEENVAIAARDDATSELDALVQQLELTRAESKSLDQETQAFRDEREMLEIELSAGRNELAGISDSLGEAQNRVAETTEELANVGARLEEATRQEADLQLRITELSSEVSGLTEAAAEAQQRIQLARDAEASLEQQLLAAQLEQENLTNTRQALQDSVDLLSEQREDLASDNLASEGQLQALQTMNGELSQMLAERGEQLVQMEDRIASMLQEASSRFRTDASAVIPNILYMHLSTSLMFSSDGTFQMQNTVNGETITGRYGLSDGSITLSDAEGDIGETRFPLTCRILTDETGFTFEDTDGSCAIIDGATFRRSDL